METIKALPEAVEGREDSAACIAARDESLGLFATNPGLGPPDLCWLSKSAKATWTASATEPQGYYHYVLGRDVSSSAAVAAYFAELCAKVEQPTSVLQGLFHSSEMKVDRGVYCCYDPFARLDVRCEIAIPGGVVCETVDADGNLQPVTVETWRNLAVASFLRHQLYDPELTSHVPTLHRWSPFALPGAEARLLDAVYDMYNCQALPAALDVITADQARGCTAEHMDIVLHTLFHWFGARHRWKPALAFFIRLQEVHVGAAVYVAAVQRELDSFDDSFATLSRALEARPSDPCLLLSLANECLYAEQTDMAAKLARRAIRLQRGLRAGWLLLARCYIRQGLFSLALITLNVLPAPPMPSPEEEALLGVIPPEPKHITQPATPRYDPDLQAVKHMASEEVVTDGSRSLLYLPAAVMLPREPLDLGTCPDLGPYRITRAVLAAVYGLLQELVAAIGWDSFLEMRARVFVMQSDTNTAAAKKSAAVEPAEPSPKIFDPDMEETQQQHPSKSPLFEATLEELAAMGLTEFPDEVAEARDANTRARMEAAKAAFLPEKRLKTATSAAPVVTAQQKDSIRHSIANVSKQSGLQTDSIPTSQSVPNAQQTQGEVVVQTVTRSVLPPHISADQAQPLSARSDAMPSVFAALQKEQIAQASEVEPIQDEQVAITGQETAETAEEPPSLMTSVLTSIPGTAALWSLMFGTQTQPARPTMDKHIISSLQQHGSQPLSSPAPQSQPSATLASLVSMGSKRISTQPSAEIVRSSTFGEGTDSAVKQPHRPSAEIVRSQPIGEGIETFTRQAQSSCMSSETLQYNPWISNDDVLGDGKVRMSRAGLRESNANGLIGKAAPIAEGDEHDVIENGMIQAGSHASNSASTQLPTVSQQQQQPNQSLQQQQLSHRSSARSDAQAAAVQKQLGLPMPVSHVEADRDFVLLGAAAIMEGVEAEQAKARRLCIRWLDELIIALWHDLQAYMEWKVLDSEVQQQTGTSLAAIILGTTETALSTRSSATNTAGSPTGVSSMLAESIQPSTPLAKAHSLPVLSAGDWMRRGLLAERLYHDIEALQAYRCCLAVTARGGSSSSHAGGGGSGGGHHSAASAINLLAAHAVMRLATEAGDMALALQACISTLQWHASHATAGAVSVYLPTAVTCCMGHVAARMGADGLKTLLNQVVTAAGLPALELGSQHGGPSSPQTITIWLKQLVAASITVA